MAGFKPSSTATPQQKEVAEQKKAESGTKSNKNVHIGIFKSIVVGMLQIGIPVEKIVEFAKNPNAETFGDEKSVFYDAVYAGIIKYTSYDERVEVLLELEKAGL